MFKIINADDRLLQIYSDISELDSTQFYFIQRFCEQERKRRQQLIFQQWLDYLHNATDTTN